MSAGQRVLIVAEDAALRRELAEQLARHEGLAVDQASDPDEARRAVDARPPDAIVLDAELPRGEAWQLCRALGRRGSGCPILLLGPSEADPRVRRALEAGAADWVAKPVRLGLLMTRLRALLHRFESSEDETFAIGPYSFRPALKTLTSAERVVHLTDKETAILRYLCRAGDRAVPREVLLGAIWGYNAGVTTHTLETHIYRLRRKLESTPGDRRLLVTEPEGYRLVRSP